ncbi:MAG: adenylate/guanylate cyclase domain-containing protein [Chitinophagales bacterium]
MKLIAFTGILLFSTYSVAFAQSALPKAEADSLWAVWTDPDQPDTSRLRAIHDYSWFGYLFNQPDSAFYFADLEYQFAKSKGLKNQMAAALSMQGVSFAIRGNHIKAIEYFMRDLELEREIGNKIGIATSLGNIANIYMDQGDYSNAIDYYTQSLKINEEIGNKQSIAGSLANIGNIYFDQGDGEKAFDYYKRSLKIFEEIDNKRGVAFSLKSIGNIYGAQDDYANAFEYFSRSFEINNEIGDKREVALTLISMGNIYSKQGDNTKAIDHYTQSLRISREMGDIQSTALALNNTGDVYMEQGKYTKALEFSSQSLALVKEAGFKLQTQNSAYSLFQVNKKLGRYKDALDMHELYISARDSVESEENQKEVIRQEFKYSYDKKAATDSVANAKQQEIKDIEIAKQQAEIKAKRNQQYGLGSGLGLMCILSVVFFTQRNRISKEKQHSEELLLNILPEETAKELKEKGSSDAKLIDQVSVIFTDFKGFTSISEQLSPKELVNDLHECFSAFDTICEKYGIEKIKTIGDAYMAAGGLPTPNTTHAKDVVKAALEMAAFVNEGKLRKQSAGLPFFEVRIGVHTGPVVAGIVGIKKFQYDIWGDTVNTASRMESSGEVGKVNISETTYEMVKDGFTCEYRGEVEAKGKGKMGMYFVEGGL